MWLLLLACSGNKDSSGETAVEPTLGNVQAQVFNLSCGYSTCHDASAGGGLSLAEGESYASLVGGAAHGDPTKTLVIAGDPDNSYLMMKLSRDGDIVGDPMPPGASVESSQLELVRGWILDGAPNN